MAANTNSTSDLFLNHEERANDLLCSYARQTQGDEEGRLPVTVSNSDGTDSTIDPTIDQFPSGDGFATLPSHVRILFMHRGKVPLVQLKRLADDFCIPAIFWETDGNGCFGSRSFWKGQTRVKYVWISALWKILDGLNSESDDLSRGLCSSNSEDIWQTPALFLHWSREKQGSQDNKITLICSDVPKTLKMSLKSTLSRPGLVDLISKEPLQLLCPFLVEWHTYNQRYFWSVHKSVIDYEGKNSKVDLSTPREPYRPDFSGMHSTAKNITHGIEMFEASNNLIVALKRMQEKLNEDDAADSDFVSNLETHQVIFENDLVQFRTLRSRMANQIDLAFNLISILDAKIAQQTNMSMSTIAILTLIFLPTTAIATTLSTPFFIPSGNYLDVRSDFGIFAAIVVLLTVIVFFTFIRFQVKMNRKHGVQTNTNV